MDDVLFEQDGKTLKISVTGLDRTSQSAAADDIRVALYAFEEGPPVNSLFTFKLDADSAARLLAYLERISVVKDRTKSASGRFVEIRGDVPADVLAAFHDHPDLYRNPGIVRAVLAMNPDLTRVIVETELDALDVRGLAYRRRQLEVMDQLLEGGDAFAVYCDQEGVAQDGQEPVWQHFFERNQWIFGFALNYVIGEGVDPEKLEKVVAGHSISGAGKRVDALLRTRGVLQSLCYVEVKTAETRLLHATPYRSEVWRPSHELAGAVAQAQKTVQKALEHIQSRLELSESGGLGREEFFNYAPRSVVVCGSLKEFQDADGADSARFSCFELFRRGIHSPEILTFDEVYSRALAVVEAGLAVHSGDLDRDDT